MGKTRVSWVEDCSTLEPFSLSLTIIYFGHYQKARTSTDGGARQLIPAEENKVLLFYILCWDTFSGFNCDQIPLFRVQMYLNLLFKMHMHIFTCSTEVEPVPC